MTTPSTALAIPAEISKVSFRTDIERWAPQIQQVAYKGFTPERVLAAALHAAVKEPKLFQATPHSLCLALMRCARLGLDIGETIHLVPLASNGKITVEAWPDYKGLKALAIRQRLVNSMEEFPVYQGDTFDYALGVESYLRHKPCLAAQRGPLIGAYSVIRLPFGGKTFHFLPLEDIEAVRAKSRSWSPAKGYKTCPPWYAMKTVVRDYLNRQPKLGALAEAMASDDTEPETAYDPETGEVLTPAQITPGPIDEPPAALGRTPDDEQLDQLLAGQ